MEIIKYEQFFWFILFLTFFILFSLLVLDSLRSPSVIEMLCKDMGGQGVMYECQTIPFAETPCSELRTGFYCQFRNGSELSYAELEQRLNSTQMGEV